MRSSHLCVEGQHYALACRLRDRQIPIDEDELERMRVASLGLRIQEGGPSFAFNLPGDGAGYVFCVDISNDARQRLSPEHIGFTELEWERSMRLLPDPRKDRPMRLPNSTRHRCEREGELSYLNAREIYAFPGLHWHRYAREQILNHSVGPGRFLYPSDPPLEGFLLAVGQEQIPWGYADGDRLKVRITVFYRGGFHAAWFQPIVERSREEKRLMEKIASSDEVRVGKK
jgi:hypothetical protein